MGDPVVIPTIPIDRPALMLAVEVMDTNAFPNLTPGEKKPMFIDAAGRLIIKDDVIVSRLLDIAYSTTRLAQGKAVTEQKTQTDAVENVITFLAAIHSLYIWHNEATVQTFVIGTTNYVVPPGGVQICIDAPIFGTDPITTVTIPAAITSCIVERLYI